MAGTGCSSCLGKMEQLAPLMVSTDCFFLDFSLLAKNKPESTQLGAAHILTDGGIQALTYCTMNGSPRWWKWGPFSKGEEEFEPCILLVKQHEASQPFPSHHRVPFSILCLAHLQSWVHNPFHLQANLSSNEIMYVKSLAQCREHKAKTNEVYLSWVRRLWSSLCKLGSSHFNKHRRTSECPHGLPDKELKWF